MLTLENCFLGIERLGWRQILRERKHDSIDGRTRVNERIKVDENKSSHCEDRPENRPKTERCMFGLN
jgi:hypothetical protein